MANATSDLITDTIGGPGPFTINLPVKAATVIYRGTLVAQDTASGMLVPYSTASSGVAVGVAQHGTSNAAGANGDKRVWVETKRAYAFKNGSGGDAFSEASLIGSVAYGTDDSTVADNDGSATRKAVGFFIGMEADGRVRVFVDPMAASLV